MITETAIKALQLGAAIEQAAAAVADHEVAALPNDFTLHDLEKFQPQRRRARGTFSTPFIAAFCAYVTRSASDGAQVFIDPTAMKAVGVLNLGTSDAPGHADDLAVLQLTKTAAYHALGLVASGQGKSQRDVAEFLEDWQHAVQCFDGATEIKPSAAVAAVRSITIEALRRVESQEQSLSASRSALESVSAKGTEQIPTTIYFKCQAYAELQERTFVLRLGISTGEKAPLIVLRVIKPEEHAEQMGNELVRRIEESLGKDCPASALIGTYSAKP
jgi:uncharacterized protein YfdQ (DUF2303 family)